MRAVDGIAFHYANNNTLNGSDVEIVKEQDALYDVPVGLVVLLSIFYGTISIIAVIGNSLVIWIVLTTKQMQTITNMFIANLALADVTIAVFAIPFQFQAAVLQRWNLPEFMCPFCPFVQLLSVNVSVFTLTAIAVDRHRAIINPLRARASKNISKFVISAIWMMSFALAAPTLFALRVVPVSIVSLGETNETYINMTKPFCQVVNFEESEMLLYRYILTLVQYFVPLCVISFVYIQMALRLWGSKTPGNAQDSRDMTMLKNKKKVIKMLIIVVALFGICWFPLQLYNILHVTWSEVNEYRYINIIWFVCDWLAMSNSCYNPFIYGIYNEKFKREFHKRYPFRGRNQSYHQEQLTDKTLSMFTRVSSIRSNYATSSIRNKLYTGPIGGGSGNGGTHVGSGYSSNAFYQNQNSHHQQSYKSPNTNSVAGYQRNSTTDRNSSRKTAAGAPWDPKCCPCRQNSTRTSTAAASACPYRMPLPAVASDGDSGSEGGPCNSAGGGQSPMINNDERQLLGADDNYGSAAQKLEVISLDHPHPDSADDETGVAETLHSRTANGQEQDERLQLTSFISSGNGRHERFHLHINNL
ncbi:substance-K receptor [Aedes aegypti]|uniref:DSK receptor n=2 Tax=Aedes aegypti TaxID=7159 RepID=A0A1S4FE52_AEDAE|nr:substance-K receptor [Aedes aegypti]XP_021707017.1 substance-K receptor [Aedes aegypti]QBC65453.1 DSK receptor [Aedes aegypti]